MPDGDMTLRQKSLQGTVKALGERQVRVIVSTPSEDREGDIIEVNGIDLKNYLKNPIILFNHKMDCPIARCSDIKNVGGRLEATAQFPAEGVNGESDKIYNLIKAGIINAASIGFIPVEWNFIDDHSWSRKFSKCEMIEFSFVSVPANAEALIIERGLQSVKDGDMTLNELKALCKGSASPMAMSVALQAAALGASLAEGLKGEPMSVTDKQPDITEIEQKSAEEEKSPKPASCEEHKTTVDDVTATGKSDDMDEDDKPKKSDDGDEDDKKSLDENTVQKTVTEDSPNPDVEAKSADTDKPNEGEQAPVAADPAPSTNFSRQKALREVELMKLKSVV